MVVYLYSENQTHNLNLIHFRVSGYMMVDKLIVPRRKIKKNWYVGLHQDPADRSQPDVQDDQLIQDAANAKSKLRKSHPCSSKLYILF